MEPIRLGILGCGSFIQRRILPFLKEMQGIKCVAIQKRDLSAAKDIAERYEIAHACKERQELLNKDLDLVFIATPNHMHEEDALASAAARKAVLCEKPLAPSVESIERMLRVFKENSLPFFVGHSLRFKPCVQIAKKMLKEGTLGELRHIHAFFSIPLAKESWRFKKSYGGGVLQDIGIHLIDLMQFITSQNIEGISALGNKEEVDTTVRAICRFKGQGTGYFESSFEEPLRSGFEVIGTKGRLISLNSLRQTFDPVETLCHVREDDSRLFFPLKASNIFVSELNHVAEVLKKKTASLIPAEISLHNQKVLEAALLSMESKKEVSL